MKTVSATLANRDFAKILERVIAGEKYQITKRGKIVAKFEAVKPVDPKQQKKEREAYEAFMKRLESQPPLNLPRISREELYD